MRYLVHDGNQFSGMVEHNRRVPFTEPAPTIMALGVGGDRITSWSIQEDDVPEQQPDPTKPSYRIPLMAEINAVRGTCGLKVAGSFSGCGGSSTGFAMAGYETVWACEFVDAARECYELNHPGVPVEARDIREVEAADVLAATGLAVGELDVFEGSPPCQSFSMAGKRAKGWGQVKQHGDGSHQRSDDLFLEYARLLRGLQPRAFVAENVAGLVRGVAKGYYMEIMRALKACGYRVAARLLDAQWLGVPQQRVRLIIVGVRNDLGRDPVFPKPLPYRYSIADALPNLAGTFQSGLYGSDYETGPDDPSPTVTTRGIGGKNGANLVGAIVTGRTGPGFRRVESELDEPMNTITAQDHRFTVVTGLQGGHGVADLPVGDQPSPTITVGSPNHVLVADPEAPGVGVCVPPGRRKFTIAELRRLCGFPDDYQLTGSYSQQWARLGNAVPPPMMRAVAEVLRDEVLAPKS